MATLPLPPAPSDFTDLPGATPDQNPIPEVSPEAVPAQPQWQPPAFTPPVPPQTETPPPVISGDVSAPPPPLDQSQGPVPATVPPSGPNLPKWLFPVIGGVVVLALIIFVVVRFVLPSSKPKSTSTKNTTQTPKATEVITLTYQGLWEPKEVMQPVIDAFEKENPNIKVNYQVQSSTDYRERLQTTLSSKTPPDIVRFHSTWLPMIYGNLQSAPSNILGTTEITANFYPVVSDAVIINNQVFAVPTTLEGLALYINQEMFDAAGLTAPQTWEDLRTAAKKLTQYDPNTNQITIAGAALGSTKNIDHWPDIVSLMMLQNGVNLFSLSPDTRVREAIEFYTLFSDTDKVWSDNLPTSTQAFAAGKVAMIFAPSWRATEIKAINPSLSWKIYTVPQLPDTTPVTWSNFWVEGVSKNSKNPTEAWRFVQYLASSQAQQVLFDTATKTRGYSQAPANKALGSRVSSNPLVGPFVQQAATAKTFYTTSLTYDGDTGINSRLIKYLENAVNGTRENQNEDEIFETLSKGFYQVLSQYNLVTPTPAPVQ